MKVVAILICMLILSKPIIPFLEYAAFFDYIKTELCINKDKPSLECNGKCHLVKQIAHTTESEEGNNEIVISPVDNFVLYYSTQLVLSMSLIDFKKKDKVRTSYNLCYSSINPDGVFRPPIFI